MLKVAFGQTKMVTRPVPAFLHLLVYAGFIIINIEILEIIIDGLFGTHRIFAIPLGSFYNFIIAVFEWLALGVIVACALFLVRRNILHLKRFSGTEMTSWPRSDANYILIFEILLMSAFLLMNGADHKLQQIGTDHHYIKAGLFPISSLINALLSDNTTSLTITERTSWWFHITGILAFLNYLPYSKHFHIIMAFPNTYYSKLEAKSQINNMPVVTNEVKAMLDPSYIPAQLEVSRFGAKDVTDLSWKSLMDAYTCTECGRCTSECPANITGKLLSPRKIMMDTRDRLEEVGKNIDKHGKEYSDEKSLLDDYIKREEIWACTTCQACVQTCPVNIDPLSIIIELRRFAIMEESKASPSINNMFNNIENNAAPWKYPSSDRLNWIKS